jgi:NADH:ubiquinone oxidoreductase subunit 3 (subunit A)
MPTIVDSDISGIAHVIQLAIAPVFLLTGIASLLGVMANRLARVIDRARDIEEKLAGLEADVAARAQRQLTVLSTRARLASWAINFCTAAALLICADIATLFIDAFVGTQLRWLVGALFILTMVALIGGLISFLREVYLATHTLSIGRPRHKKH